MIDAPGIYPNIPAAEYHADCCVVPSLSSSIIKVLVGQSPLHAWTEHPRLNPAHVSQEAERFDIGTAAHSLLLEGQDCMVVVDAKDWRTNAAKEARDAARKAGKVPVLTHQRDDIMAMVTVAQAAVIECEMAELMLDMLPEQTLVWREGETWCRARPDWRRPGLMMDYKSTENAEPQAWAQTKLISMGYDVQSAWYLRGLKALTGETMAATDFIFMVQETSEPYACSFVGVTPYTLELGRRKVDQGLAAWSRCMATGRWPAYTNKVCWFDPAPWQMARQEEREQFNEMLGGQA